MAVNVVGRRDLARMRQGRVDPAGEAGTRWAMWWGDMGTAMAGLGGVFCAPGRFLAFLNTRHLTRPEPLATVGTT